MAIDPNAMYRAGFSSTGTGRNVEQEEKNKFWEGVTKTAYNVLGNAAIRQVNKNYQSLQMYRNAADSQIGTLNLQVNKMPDGNESLLGDVTDLGKLYSKAVKKASFGIGRGRSKGRQEAAGYMKQLQDFNAFMELYKPNTEASQDMVRVLSGKREGGDNETNVHPGADPMSLANTLEQANGLLGKRLKWNIEKGRMDVLVGGEWQTVDGKNVYVSKAETGTYEEYVKETSELDETIDYGPGTRYGKKDQSVEPMSKEEWTKLNQENRGLVSQIAFSKLKFAEKEDNTFEKDLRALQTIHSNGSWKKDSKPWENFATGELGFDEFQAKINDYNDAQFRDFYFGGFSFDHSSQRMSKSAPAYQRLKKEDQIDGNLEEDGITWKKGHGPGSPDWEGRLLSLKGQSFVSGSYFRQKTAKDLWAGMETKYKANQIAYKTEHPDIVENGDGITKEPTGVQKFPSLGTAGYTAGGDGVQKWLSPAIKQKAFNVFSVPQQDGTTFDGQHAYYVLVAPPNLKYAGFEVSSKWYAYSSLDDYKKDKASGFKNEGDFRKGTYSQEDVLGFEAGVSGKTNVDIEKL